MIYLESRKHKYQLGGQTNILCYSFNYTVQQLILTWDLLSLFWDLNSSMSSNSKSSLLASLTQSLVYTLTAILCSILSSGIAPPKVLRGAGVGPVLLNCGKKNTGIYTKSIIIQVTAQDSFQLSQDSFHSK